MRSAAGGSWSTAAQQRPSLREGQGGGKGRDVDTLFPCAPKILSLSLSNMSENTDAMCDFSRCVACSARESSARHLN